MQTILDQIKQETEKFNDLRKQVEQNHKKLLGEAIKEVFEKHGDWLTSFSWTQYTPYFNDGDVCEFGVNLDSYSTQVNGEDFDEVDFLQEYTSWKKEEKNPNFDANKSQVIKDLQELIGSIGEENLKAIFGDHVKVVLTQDGFETEDYDHE